MTETTENPTRVAQNDDQVIIENLTRQVHNFKNQVENLQNTLNGVKQRTCDILLNVDEEKARMRLEIETRDKILVNIANKLGVDVPSMPAIEAKIQELRSSVVEAASLKEKLKKFASKARTAGAATLKSVPEEQ